MAQRPGRYSSGMAIGMSLAFEFAGAVGLFWFFGWLADRQFGTDPWFQVVGSVIGWIGGIVHVYVAVQRRQGDLGK